MKGWIYIMKRARENALKIGKTSRTPEQRAEELSATTGVPTPFVVVYKRSVNDMDYCEKVVHERLSSYKFRKEFFDVDIKIAINTIDDVCDQFSNITIIEYSWNYHGNRDEHPANKFQDKLKNFDAAEYDEIHLGSKYLFLNSIESVNFVQKYIKDNTFLYVKTNDKLVSKISDVEVGTTIYGEISSFINDPRIEHNVIDSYLKINEEILGYDKDKDIYLKSYKELMNNEYNEFIKKFTKELKILRFVNNNSKPDLVFF